MIRTVSVILLTLFVMVAFAHGDTNGDKKPYGQFEFTYPNKNILVRVDGINLTPTDNMKAVIELPQGEHLVQVFEASNTSNEDLITEETVKLQDGLRLRATLKNGQLAEINTVPIPDSAEEIAETPLERAESALLMGKMTASIEEISYKKSHSTADVGMTVEKRPTIVDSREKILAEPIATPPMPIKSSRIVVMSEEGNCEVFLDGQKKLELGFGDIDEMAMGKILDVQPGTYLLRIDGFETWYDGKLDVGSGEVIKIRTEPGKMEIVSRVFQP